MRHRTPGALGGFLILSFVTMARTDAGLIVSGPFPLIKRVNAGSRRSPS